MANFENAPDGPKLCVEDLLRDGGFLSCGFQPRYQAFIAEAIYSGGVRKPIGYAVSYFGYSTWVGRSLFLEDLYIQPYYRYKGVGRMVIQKVAEYAREERVARLDLHCLNWNPGVEFYKKLGAVDITSCEDWHLLRLTDNDIDRLAEC